MKIFPLFFIFAFFYNSALCQNVGFISGQEEVNSYTKTDDFSNTFEINIAPLLNFKPGQKTITFVSEKCQAVRLNKNWFITAAHCVDPICKKGCSLQTRLVVGPSYEMDIISQSTSTSPQIFIHPGRDIKKNISTYDIALIYFKPLTSKYVYKNPRNLKAITRQEFMHRLKSYSNYKKALSSHNTPTLLIMDSSRKAGPVLTRKFTVLSAFTDRKKVLRSNNKAIYSPKTKTFILENFGIKQGISGSGLMTSKGEIAGITSTISDPKNVDQLAQFAAFDKTTLDFIQDKIGSIDYTILK